MNRMFALTLVASMFVIAGEACADAARDQIMRTLSEQAKAADPAFSDFSAMAGESFWQARHEGGKPDTPSCTSCHTQDPAKPGETRAGKSIDPMAVSVSPTRFTDFDKVEKWFTRNCNSVLGRECTAKEKGDVLSYLISK